MMFKRFIAAIAALLFVAAPAAAQWQVQDNAVPIGKGGGSQGFKFAPPGAINQVLTSNGPGAAPTFRPSPTLSGELFFPSRTDAIAATIAPAINAVTTGGFNTLGDGGEGTYLRVGSLCAGAGCFTTADGAFWRLDYTNGIDCRQFGAVPQGSLGGADQAPFLNACIAFYNTFGPVTVPNSQRIRLSSGMYLLDSRLTTFTTIASLEGECGSSQPTVLYKRYVEADPFLGVVSMTTHGGYLRCIQWASQNGVASGGSFVSAILPNAAANIGILRLENMRWSSATDGTRQQVYINGCTNVNPSGPGYRTIYVTNSEIFGAAVTPLNLQCVHHFFATNIFIAGGLASGGTSPAAYTIGGTAAAYSDDIHIHSGIIAGAISLDRVNRSTISGMVVGNINNTNTVDQFTVLGTVDGTIQTNWLRSGQVGGNGFAGNFTLIGQIAFPNTGLKIFDTDAVPVHVTTLTFGSNLTANRTLTINTGDADRILTLSGNSTINQDLCIACSVTFAKVTHGDGAVNNPTIAFANGGGLYSTANTNVAFTNGTTQYALFSNTGFNSIRSGAANVSALIRSDTHGPSQDVGQLSYTGMNASGSQAGYARLDGVAVSDTAGAHTGRLGLRVAVAGAVTEKVRLEGSVFSPSASAGTALGDATLPWSSYVGNAAQTLVTTVGALGTCNAGATGTRRMVNNSNAASYTAGIGAIVAAGGAVVVPVVCDGTNWRIG